MPPLVDTRMPGVYTQEIPTLPPSIGVVQSAVPCFIGYTEKATKDGKDVTLKAVRVRNMRDYEIWFGTSPNQEITVDIDEMVDDSDPTNPKTARVDVRVVSINAFKFRMHYALQLYYANGGGPCFVISVGAQSGDTVDVKDLVKGIDAAKLAKDVTILAYPDACLNLSDDNYYNVLAFASMLHCDKMKNRVVILDVSDTNKDNADVTKNFRSKVPQNINQKYAAAYYPLLATTLDYVFDGSSAKIRFHYTIKSGVKSLDTTTTASKTAFDALEVAQKALNVATHDRDVLKKINETVETAIAANAAILPADLKSKVEPVLKKEFKLTAIPASALPAFSGANAAAVDTAINTLLTTAEGLVVTKTTEIGTAKTAYTTAVNTKKGTPLTTDFSFRTLGDIQPISNLVYNRIKEAIQDLPVLMPPSSAIAALYVQTDATQGVWRSPANFGLAAVVEPTVEIDDDFHADLNSDATSGKSVNAIRAYEGKGILVFGARTLAGNDLEWRYVSVRRTFCFIEDSVARAMQDFVFSPNTRDTWIKAKSMISNFLNNIWQAGGLFGNTPNEAYAVNVGHPETMGDIDILEGRMIVEIKLRVSRPAEFIILRYEHKFQANAS